MTNPSDPTSPQPEGAEPAVDTAAPASADDQPTEAYAPTDAQPTTAYPPVDAPPAPPAPPAAYGEPQHDQPVTAAPVSAADRPRTLAWTSLGLAIAGVVLVGAAFIPLAWVSLILVLVGGLLLLVALVLGIVTLVNKKQGGKGLGIGAIAVSVFGGILWVAALTAALVWIGLSMAASSNESVPSPEASVSEEAAPGEDEAAAEEAPVGTYDEAAYLAAVRPEILAIMQEIEPSMTEELVAQFYTDDILVTVGESVLLAGDAGGDVIVESLVAQSEGMFNEDQAVRFYTVIYESASQYLGE